MKMNKATRVLVLILGIILLLFGFVLMATPGLDAVILGYFICTVMLIYGIAQIVFYGSHRKLHVVSGWVLADGILTAILGLLLLFMPGAQIMTMTVVFAVWVLFSGIMSFAGAFAAKDAGSHDWGWNLAAGIIGMVLGFWLMCDPLLSLMSIGYLLPFTLLFQGGLPLRHFSRPVIHEVKNNR